MTNRKTFYALIVFAGLMSMIVCLTPQCAMSPSPATNAAQATVTQDASQLAAANAYIAGLKAAAATQPGNSDVQSQLATAQAQLVAANKKAVDDAAALATSKQMDNYAAGVKAGQNISSGGTTVTAVAPIGGPYAGIIAMIGAGILAIGNGVQGYYNSKLKGDKTSIAAIAQQAIAVGTNIVQSIEAGKAAPGGVVLSPVAVTAISAIQTPDTKAAVNAVQAGLPSPLQTKLDAATA